MSIWPSATLSPLGNGRKSYLQYSLLQAWYEIIQFSAEAERVLLVALLNLPYQWIMNKLIPDLHTHLYDAYL
jgi:hypothetical protein